MAKIIIEFPSIEMANLFASTFKDGTFASFINRISMEDNHPEMLDDFMGEAVVWDKEEMGNHKIDITDYLINKS